MQTIYEEESSDSGTEADNEKDNGSDSTTVTPSVTDYVYENGRRYHRFREGSYPLPNDESEQERLDRCHKLWTRVMKGRPWKVPVDSPQKVLDIGCGTGAWAIMIADMFPNARVIGTELSPIQPSMVPLNVRFYIEDAEDEWTFDKGFDLVHGRMLAGSIHDWTKFFGQAFAQLKPGGWLEMNEIEAKFYYQNENDERCVQLDMLTQVFNRESTNFGKGFNDVLLMPEAMRNAGFEDITIDIQKVPIGQWPENYSTKDLGLRVQAAAIEAIEPYILAIGTRVVEDPAWSIREIVRASQMSLHNRNYQLYVQAHFIWGRKPNYS
ncbi:conserved hypothetical protein [Talaromyces stipitatus ATCC 10500]|uniref:Methyltransferase n=1 Tax=Talaromyces stipitatus (strain ATCC 10500 / CBS 375.48 / QM 6759 / NRRL 1006) TaxID=441959 RepID=B8MDT5_TALSN|nr:uncharacterized protein TSTA_120610 [Talaromyces stipitatus ATCC 10500]EED18314.1 conserved hypothetical protein [Talaromyces stipitatus ATCC 10500]